MWKKIILISLISCFAVGVAFAQSKTQISASETTLKQLVGYASGNLSHLSLLIQGKRWAVLIPKNASVDIIIGSGNNTEKYYLDMQNLKIIGSGIGATTRPMARATIDSKSSFTDILNYRLGLKEAFNSGKLKITGVGIFNKIKINAIMGLRKFIEK